MDLSSILNDNAGAPRDNGRVQGTLSGDNFNLYNSFKEARPYTSSQASQEAIKNIHTQNALSDMFFSRANIDVLHEAIRYMVYKKSCGKHVIDRQSETDLLIIMRSVYLQYGEYKPYLLKEQVKDLNTQVINYCVPKILEEIKIYLHYRKDISQLPEPMDRGEFVSSKGTKVLEQRW